MRSGQYKLTSSSSKVGDSDAKETLGSGNFKMASKEFPLLSPLSPNDQSISTQFINLDSLQLSILQRLDSKDDSRGSGGGGGEGVKKKFKESIYKGIRKKESILRHKSCENVSILTKGTVNRVEQKVRSLLRVDSKWSHGDAAEIKRDREACIESLQTDLWPAGKIITTTKKPRLIGAHSISALHAISAASSDSASCLSASSGYSSSSSSSSYGSFKSSESVCSSLPRHRNSSCGSQSGVSDQVNRIFFADNPLYDVIPQSDLSQINDSSMYSSIDFDKFSEEISLPEDNVSPSYSAITDPIAKQCIKFFENRLSSSETLRRKWNLYVSEPNDRYNSINSDLISKGDAVIDSKFNAGFDSDMSLGVESNFSLTEFPDDSLSKSLKKNVLDEKMDYLREEIASLILQDDNLFKQLLSLHETIAILKARTTSAPSGAHLHDSSPLRSHSPSDLESFTEEDELEELDEAVSEIQLRQEAMDMGSSFKNESSLQDEDDDNEDKKKKNTLEDNNNNNNNDNDDDDEDDEDDNDNNNNDLEEEEDEYEDEGHGTDLSSLGQSTDLSSLGQTSSSGNSSSSPSSTLSSNSSEGLSFSRNLYSEMTSDFSGSFTRCRKSYAPNARNRRRSSSVNSQKSPTLECGTTTALVVIYADDEDILLNSNRQRSHSFSPLTSCTIHDALTYAESKHNNSNGSKSISSSQSGPHSLGNQNSTLLNGGRELTMMNSKGTITSLTSFSTETSNSLPLSGVQGPDHSHPPYREALIM